MLTEAEGEPLALEVGVRVPPVEGVRLLVADGEPVADTEPVVLEMLDKEPPIGQKDGSRITHGGPFTLF